MATQVKLDWSSINTAAFKGDMKATFATYLKAKKAADEAWQAFANVAQPKAQELADDGMEAVVIYKRGKVLMAFKEPGATTSANKGDVTL